MNGCIANSDVGSVEQMDRMQNLKQPIHKNRSICCWVFSANPSVNYFYQRIGLQFALPLDKRFFTIVSL